jgi:hypothetical protein
MLSLLEFKKSLGPKSYTLSEEEIEHLRLMFDRIADAAFDQWLEKRNTGMK